MSTHVAVTQSVLAWALQRADRSYEKTVKKFPKLGDWLSGDALPSLRELEKFASFTHVSLGALIMPEPPDETLPATARLSNVLPVIFSIRLTATSNSRTGTTIMLANRGLRNFHSSVP